MVWCKASCYLAIGRLFLVKSMRWMAKGMEHTASTLTTLKAENLTWGETTHTNTNKTDKHLTGLFFFFLG